MSILHEPTAAFPAYATPAGIRHMTVRVGRWAPASQCAWLGQCATPVISAFYCGVASAADLQHRERGDY